MCVRSLIYPARTAHALTGLLILYKKSLCLNKIHARIMLVKITAHGTSGIFSCLLDVAENKLHMRNAASVTGPMLSLAFNCIIFFLSGILTLYDRECRCPQPFGRSNRPSGVSKNPKVCTSLLERQILRILPCPRSLKMALLGVVQGHELTKDS